MGCLFVGGTRIFWGGQRGDQFFFQCAKGGDQNFLRVKEGGTIIFAQFFFFFAPSAQSQGDQNFSPYAKGGQNFWSRAKGGTRKNRWPAITDRCPPFPVKNDSSLKHEVPMKGYLGQVKHQGNRLHIKIIRSKIFHSCFWPEDGWSEKLWTLRKLHKKMTQAVIIAYYIAYTDISHTTWFKVLWLHYRNVPCSVPRCNGRHCRTRE